MLYVNLPIPKNAQAFKNADFNWGPEHEIISKYWDRLLDYAQIQQYVCVYWTLNTTWTHDGKSQKWNGMLTKKER